MVLIGGNHSSFNESSSITYNETDGNYTVIYSEYGEIMFAPVSFLFLLISGLLLTFKCQK